MGHSSTRPAIGVPGSGPGLGAPKFHHGSGRLNSVRLRVDRPFVKEKGGASMFASDNKAGYRRCQQTSAPSTSTAAAHMSFHRHGRGPSDDQRKRNDGRAIAIFAAVELPPAAVTGGGGCMRVVLTRLVAANASGDTGTSRTSVESAALPWRTYILYYGTTTYGM